MDKNKVKDIIIIIVVILLAIGILIYKIYTSNFKEINNSANEKKYDISVTTHSVVKVNDSYFQEQKKEEYKDYDLIFVSFTMKNNTSKNIEHITYKLKTSNENSYSSTNGNYIMKDKPYLIGELFEFIGYEDTNNKKLLGEQEKRAIVGFLISKNEFKDETNFELVISADSSMQPLKFKNENIKNSDNLKELFTDNEIEEIEQKIGLYYLIENTLNTKNSQVTAWNSNDVKSLRLYLATSIACLTTNFPVSWNGQYLDVNSDGYKFNYEKSKQLFPNIKSEIERLEGCLIGLQNTQNTLEKYNNIRQVNYNEYNNSIAGIGLAWYNIKNEMTK